MLHRPTARESFLAQLDEFSARVRDAFLSAIADIRSKVTLAQVVALLERRDTEGVIRTLNVTGTAFNPMLDEIEAAYSAGGNGANTELPTLRGSDGFPIWVTFDQRNPAAEAWIKQNGATLIRQITDDQANMLRQVISQDVGLGKNSRQIALDIVGRISRVTGRREGGLIGLTASQEQWAANYETALEAGSKDALTYTLRDTRFDRSVLKAINAGEKLPGDLVDKMVSAYRNRALKFRGQAIGQTESHTALNAGRDEAMRQAIGSGAVSGNLVDDHWHTHMDGRERASHAAMNDQVVPFGQAFISGAGNRLQYPGDPSVPAEDRIGCRCFKTFSIRKAS